MVRFKYEVMTISISSPYPSEDTVTVDKNKKRTGAESVRGKGRM